VCGLRSIVVSALALNSSTPYPGSAVALPVISSATLIAVGCANPKTLVGRGLSIRPMQWLGARSYSLYLWHWPVLIIAGTIAVAQWQIATHYGTWHLFQTTDTAPTLDEP
jgi:peptidoglycan/LPS O-acetylase OafA/YrhL